MKIPVLIILLLLALQGWTQTPNFALVGFATVNGGTTGGAGGTEVTVSTYADLKRYAEEADTKYIIKIAGTIKGTGSVASGNYAGSIKVKSNKTILGMGSTAFLDGVGLSISGVKNIIVRNIRFSFISIGKAIPAGSGDIPGIYSALGDEGKPQILVNAGDLISISGSNSNIWIDHCEFYEEDPATQTNIDLYDGLIDIKNDSRYITISWCYFHDHHKCTLIGSADTDLFAERKITFHHNYYNKVGSRIPLIRGGIAHVFNNYIYGAGGCSNSRMGACVKSEKNYFENSKNAVYSASSSQVGYAQVVDNKLVNSTTTTLGACTAAIPYSYTAVLTTDPNNVKSIVITYSGVGKLDVPPVVIPKKYIYTYDNSGNLSWNNTNSWTPKAVPTAIDTVIIRTGEVQIANLNHTAPVYVEINGILRLVDTSAVNDLRLQGGTLKAFTSSPGFVLTSNIKVEAPSAIMCGSVAATIFTLNGTITGSSDLTKTSVGNLRINSNASTFKGNWIVSEGKLQLRSTNGLGMCGVQVRAGALLDIEAAATIYSLVVDSTGKVDVDQSLSSDVVVLGKQNVLSGSYNNASTPNYIGGSNMVTVKQNVLKASGSTTLCTGATVQLQTLISSTYIWKNASTQVGTAQNYTAGTTGDYTVTVSNANGCKVTSAAVPVGVSAAPVALIAAGSSTSICSGASVTLSSSGGSSYKWFNGTTQVGTNQTYTASTLGDYTVEVTNAAGCKATSAKTTVAVNSLPVATISAGSSTTLCSGESVTLTSSAGSSYKWFNGTTQVGTSQTFTANTAGDYSVEVTNSAGCKATSIQTTVLVNSLPNATITATTPTTLCQGESVTLTASQGSSYRWFSGATQVGTAQTYTASASGDYTVEITNSNGCKSKSTQTTIIVNSLPEATITAGSSTNVCSGEAVMLSSTLGASYKWYHGDMVVGNSLSYSATAAGIYKVEVTNANGCKAISPSITVQVDIPSIPVIISDGTTELCVGKSVTFSTDAANAYTWYHGTTPVGSSETLTATEAGEYKVETTNANGCKAISSAITVEVSTCTPTPVKTRQKELVIKAFPNPFTEEVQIELKGAFKYQLVDCKGTLVEVGEGNDYLRIGNNLKPGLYLVILENTAEAQTISVVKE